MKLLEDLKAKYQANGQDSAQNLCVLKRADVDLGHLAAWRATAKDFRDYRASRPNATTATVNRVLQAVRAAYRLALKRGELACVPYIEVLSEKGK